MKIQDFLDCGNCEQKTPESRFEFVREIGEVREVYVCAHGEACERLWKRNKDKFKVVD